MSGTTGADPDKSDLLSPLLAAAWEAVDTRCCSMMAAASAGRKRLLDAADAATLLAAVEGERRSAVSTEYTCEMSACVHSAATSASLRGFTDDGGFAAVEAASLPEEGADDNDALDVGESFIKASDNTCREIDDGIEELLEFAVAASDDGWLRGVVAS